MTAMVDVAFLLLTFFILTTTLTQPHGIFLATPVDDGPPGKITHHKVLTLILGDEDKVYYYHGLPESNYTQTDFSEQGVRQVIWDHLNRHENRCKGEMAGKCWDPIFVVKPRPDSRYKNLVDVLDELELADAPKYSYSSFGRNDSLYWADRRIER